MARAWCRTRTVLALALLVNHRALSVRNARHIMNAYRRYLMAYKFKQNEQRSIPNKRAARGLIYYRAYVEAYLAAKRAVVAGEELVDA